MATKSNRILVCKSSFHTPAGFVAAGDMYESDRPEVRDHPEKFEALKVHRVARKSIEQATSAPGEKR